MAVHTIMFGRNIEVERDVIIVLDIASYRNHGLYELYADDDQIIWYLSDSFAQRVIENFVEIYDISTINEHDVNDIIQYGEEIMGQYTSSDISVEEFIYTKFVHSYGGQAPDTPPGELLYNIMTRRQ